MQKSIDISRELRMTRRRENIAGYVFMTPALLFFLGFVIFPMGMCLATSFFNYTMTDFTFIGVQNYVEAFSSPVFRKAFMNTLRIVVVSVPTVCMFSLWVASVTYNMNDRYTSFFRITFYLPVVMGSVAIAVVWKLILRKDDGILTTVLQMLGLNLQPRFGWLGSPQTALWFIITILFTTSIGQPIVLYISALANMDHSLVEAANVDGATKMQTFWRIKWPQIMPTTLYILVITTINSFQCFALIELLTSGGPNHSTDTIMYYIYKVSLDAPYRYGYGSAMGVLLAIIIAIFSAIQFKYAQTDNG